MLSTPRSDEQRTNPCLASTLLMSDTVRTLGIKVMHVQVPLSLLRTVYMSCLLTPMSRAPHTGPPVVALCAGEVLALLHTLLQTYYSTTYKECVWYPNEAILVEPDFCFAIVF